MHYVLTSLLKGNMKTVNYQEISKFSQYADQWWNEDGKFKPLHVINPIRVSYITGCIKAKINKDLSSILVLDIGCGGGILSESIARIGVKVSGIDVSQENIHAAQLHAKKVGLEQIEYKCASVEELEKENKYDVILCMEVIEHVDNLAFFVEKSVHLLKPGGLIFISTLNRTIKSFVFAIIGAEYVLKWLPKGTHSWNKFVKPAEIAEHLRKDDVAIEDIKGIKYSIINNQWQLTDDISINYILTGVLMKNKA